MSLESTYRQSSNPVPDTSAKTDKQPDAAPTVASLVSSDSASRQEHERISKGIGQMLASESKSASLQLPLLTLDGLLKSDAGEAKPAQGEATNSKQTDALDKRSQAAEEKVSFKGDSTLIERKVEPDGFSEEPEAVRKYYEKFKKTPTDKNPPPSDGPENKPDTDDRAPDPKPEAKLKPHYKTDEVEQAIRLAKENNLPVIVHVGASWCGPCRTMEKNAWPEIEKDAQVNQKAVYIHLDVDKAKDLQGKAAALAKQMQDGVQSFPTVKVMNVGGDKDNLSLTSVGQGSFMSASQLKNFIQKNVK